MACRESRDPDESCVNFEDSDILALNNKLAELFAARKYYIQISWKGGRFISCLLPTSRNTNKPASFEILVQLLWPQLLRSDRATYALKLTEKKQSTNGSMLLNKSKI